MHLCRFSFSPLESPIPDSQGLSQTRLLDGTSPDRVAVSVKNSKASFVAGQAPVSRMAAKAAPTSANGNAF